MKNSRSNILLWRRNLLVVIPPKRAGLIRETMARFRRIHLLILVVLLLITGTQFCDGARTFTIVNYCRETIWPAIIPGQDFGGGGFVLRPGQTVVLTAPVEWSGRIWGRTGCNFDRTGNGTCQTGRCGSSLHCTASGEPPSSLAEFTLSSTSLDFYDVSLVDGFNLPMVVTPLNGRGNCSVAGCIADLRSSCPSELAVRGGGGRNVACRSACDVFDTDEYCCRGLHGNPSTCQPTSYSRRFKEACPTAYSYAYDDPSSIFTCSTADYVVAFCSSRRQPVCTYHNNKLMCNRSMRLRPLSSGKWWMMIFGLIITTLLWKL